jgi:hypothetical protein
MANTTNFNWETPDDTDLVKDGAAAIRTLGSAIDTSLVDLKGGTTGQVLSKTSNTDMDFIWVAQDDSNAIQNAIVDAKGDIIAASANDTPARLAVGTNDHRLVAASGEATGLKYVADTQNTVIDAEGDLLVGDAADTLQRLAIGSNGHILTVDTSVDGKIKWAAASGGGVTTATFVDSKATGTNGGTFTNGAWRTRDLNTSVFNNITSCSLSSNQISLPAGTYTISAQAPAFEVHENQTRFYNITDSTVELIGSSAYNSLGTIVANSFIYGTFTIAATKTYELQHRCVITKSTNGFGVDNNAAFSLNNYYSQITITKVG